MRILPCVENDVSSGALCVILPEIHILTAITLIVTSINSNGILLRQLHIGYIRTEALL